MPVAGSRPERRPDPCQGNRRFAARRPHLNWDQWARRRQSRCRWSSDMNSWARSSRSGRPSQASCGSAFPGEGHIVCGKCPQLPRGRGHLCATRSRRRQSPGSFAELSAFPEYNVVSIPTTCRTRSPQSSIPSVTPSIRRSPSISSARTFWSPVPGRSAIMGAMVAKRLRCPQGGDYRHQPRSSGSRAQARHRPRRRRFEGKSCRRHAGDRHDRGFDVGLEMSALPPAFAI